MLVSRISVFVQADGSIKRERAIYQLPIKKMISPLPHENPPKSKEMTQAFKKQGWDTHRNTQINESSLLIQPNKF